MNDDYQEPMPWSEVLTIVAWIGTMLAFITWMYLTK